MEKECHIVYLCPITQRIPSVHSFYMGANPGSITALVDHFEADAWGMASCCACSDATIRNISHLLPQIQPCPVSAASAMQSLKNTIFIMKRNLRMIPASPGSDPARARVHTFFQHVTWLARALESFSSIFQLEWKPGTALRCVARRFQSGFSLPEASCHLLTDDVIFFCAIADQARSIVGHLNSWSVEE